MSGANRRDCQHKLCPALFRLRRREDYAGCKASTARRRGVLLLVQKEPKYAWDCAPRPRSPGCAGYEYCFSLNNREKQIRTARRWASKEPAAHFYRPRAGARKGEPPPLSPPLRRGTMVQVKQILLSLQNHFLGKSQSRTPATATHPIPPQSRAAVSPCTKCEWGAKMFHVKHFYFRLRSSSSSATRW